jgi:hypothetical protein
MSRSSSKSAATFVGISVFFGTLLITPAALASKLLTSAGSLNHSRAQLFGRGALVCRANDDQTFSLAPMLPRGSSRSLPLSLAVCPHTTRTLEPEAGIVLVADKPAANGADRTAGPSPLDSLILPPLAGGTRRAEVELADELAVRSQLDLIVPNLINANAKSRAELDRIVTAYRNNKDRSPSGLWKLRLVYHGIGHVVSEVMAATPELMPPNRKTVDDWIAESPNSPTPYLFKALMLRNHIYALLRSPLEPATIAHWNNPAFRMMELRQFLNQYKAVASADPHWYSLMIEVMGLQGESRDAIMSVVDEAVEREPIYHETYFAALRAIMPRSDQPMRELVKLATYAVEKTKASEGGGLYARLFWIALSEMGDDRTVETMYQNWDKVRLGIERVVADFPAQWNIQHFAFFSCIARDKKTTRLLMERMRGRRYAQAWQQLEVQQACQDWAKSPDQAPPPATRASAP